MSDKRNYMFVAALVLVFLAVAAGLFYYLVHFPADGRQSVNASANNSFVIDKSDEGDDPADPLQISGQPPAQETTSEIQVHITGAVKEPGVYELPSGSRINDALTAAGGETDEADLERINLAGYAADAQQIYIPRKGEEFQPVVAAGQDGDGRININTASAKDLTALPGIGEATAEAIVRHREQNGAFKTPEDIKKVARIGEKTYGALKDMITVGE